jgi:transposase InsO family protein
MRFGFIAMNENQFAVRRMCQVLGVSPSGYYAWRGRQPSARQMANHALVEQIAVIHRQSRQTYGSPRVYRELRAAGVACGVNRVARLMRQQGIAAKPSRAQRHTTRPRQATPTVPSRLADGAEPVRPNQVWLADITYVPTGEGGLYLACIMDRFSRRIIGWAMDRTLAVELVKRALRMALRQRRPTAGLIHHSDRGSQYTARAYQALLRQRPVPLEPSYARHCLENAHQESFFGTLKQELVHHQRYATRRQARQDIFRYIEGFYNTHRRHSALGFVSPAAFEADFFAQFP